jgi:hypothetical protein
MLLQILVIFVCVFAAFLQWAAIRSPETSNLRILLTARRINSMALMMGAGYIMYCLYQYGLADPVMGLVFGIYGLSQVLFAMHTFFEPSCTDRLMASPSSKERMNEASLT